MVRKIKTRRVKRELDSLEDSYLPEDPQKRADPAASDPELAKKLDEGWRSHAEETLRVFDEYALRSAELGEQGGDSIDFCWPEFSPENWPE